MFILILAVIVLFFITRNGDDKNITTNFDDKKRKTRNGDDKNITISFDNKKPKPINLNEERQKSIRRQTRNREKKVIVDEKKYEVAKEKKFKPKVQFLDFDLRVSLGQEAMLKKALDKKYDYFIPSGVSYEEAIGNNWNSLMALFMEFMNLGEETLFDIKEGQLLTILEVSEVDGHQFPSLTFKKDVDKFDLYILKPTSKLNVVMNEDFKDLNIKDPENLIQIFHYLNYACKKLKEMVIKLKQEKESRSGVTFSLIMQIHLILDYLVDTEKPEHIGYTATSLFESLNNEACKDQYIIPRMRYVGNLMNAFKEGQEKIALESAYKNIILDNACAKTQILYNIPKYKEVFLEAGYHKFVSDNKNKIIEIHETFETLLRGDIKYGSTEEAINIFMELRENLYSCLHRNEVIALHEEGTLINY